MEYRLVARSGCSDLVPPVVLLEEEIATIEGKNPEEVAKKLRGEYLIIEGIHCVLFSSISEQLVQLLREKGNIERFRKWWGKADVQEIKNHGRTLRGKLFIIIPK